MSAACAELVALATDVRESPARAELAAAIARRDTLLWARGEGAGLTIHELVAREAGIPPTSPRGAGQTGRDPVTIHYLAAIERALAALGVGTGSNPPGHEQLIRAAQSYHRLRRHYHVSPGMAEQVGALRTSCSAPDADCPANDPDFARDIVAAARRARELVARLRALDERDRVQVEAMGKAARSSRRVHLAMQRWPIASIERVMAASGLCVQAATSGIHRLRGIGVVREIARRHRRRLYIYDDYIALLADDVASWSTAAADVSN